MLRGISPVFFGEDGDTDDDAMMTMMKNKFIMHDAFV